jgi:hypothetical protein
MCALVKRNRSLRRVRGKPIRLDLPAAVVLAAALVLALMLPQTALAQHGGGGGWHGGGGGGGGGGGSGWSGGGGGGGGGGWHGGGGNWHGGSWHQGWYGSRYGWWWVIPGFGWYAYDAPIYPYPDPDAYTQAISAPPFWYYCSNPAGYYPYVAQCSGPWQPVPAQPPPPGFTPQPGYAPQAGGPGNSTANDLNRQELNRLPPTPGNPPLSPYYPPPPAN